MKHIYTALLDAGVQLDNHESDLYAKVSDTSRAIIKTYYDTYTIRTFRSEIDGELWYDIPFAFLPFWERRSARA